MFLIHVKKEEVWRKLNQMKYTAKPSHPTQTHKEEYNTILNYNSEILKIEEYDSNKYKKRGSEKKTQSDNVQSQTSSANPSTERRLEYNIEIPKIEVYDSNI